jgi:hypothetical protein
VSFIYVIALVAVGAIIVCAAVEAMLATTRKAPWEVPRRAVLDVVETDDRRRQDLPFVGQERRRDKIAAQDAGVKRRKAA